MPRRAPLRLLLGALALAGTACPPAPAPDAGTPGLCLEGRVPRANGHGCEPASAPPDSCPAGTMPVLGATECQPVGWTTCPSGFEPDPSGWGCRDVVPADDCPPGTFAVLGQRACQPVGWTSCDGGFTPDPSGWGCEAVLPAAACTGATLERIGSPGCEPIDDCAAPFPPASATVFVDAAFTTEDATHFRTLGAAIAAAPAGATIAVEAGRYAEALTFTQPVTLVGRCAEQVVLAGDGGINAGLGVPVQGVTVRGLTVTGHRGGAVVVDGGALSLEGVVLVRNRELGLYAEGQGTVATATRLAVRDTETGPAGQRGHGIGVLNGATVTLRHFAVSASHFAGLTVSGAGVQLTASDGVVRDTRLSPEDDEGYGLFAAGGATARLERVAFVSNQGMGLLATNPGTSVSLSDAVVKDTRPTPFGENGLGAYVDFGADLALTRTALVKNFIIGVNVVEGGSGAIVDSVVRATRPKADGTFGHGVNAQSVGSALRLSGTAIVDSREMGLAVLEGATAAVERSVIRDTSRSPSGRTGLGVGALVAEAATLSFTTSAFVKNRQVGLVVSWLGVGTGEGSLLGLSTRDPDPSAPLVQGVDVEIGGQLELSRSSIFENEGVGVYAWGESRDGGVPSRATLTHCLVRDNRPPMPRPGETGSGAGVLVEQRAEVRVVGGGFVGNLSSGFVVDPGGSLDVEDAVVRDNLIDSTGEFGRGLNVQNGRATLRRTALVGNHDISIFVADPASSAALEACLVADTQPDGYGFFGRGAEVLTGGRLSIRGSAFLDSHELGVDVVGPGSSASMVNTLLDGVVQAPDGHAGYGVLADDQGQVELDGVWVRRASTVGLAFAGGAAAALRRSFISDHPVGLNVQELQLVEVDGAPPLPSPGVVAVSRDTEFVDVLVRLGAGSLPLPPVTSGIKEDPQH